ncbi:ABC transporter permease [Flavihumibacter petaseus]|uniref:ABC transporter permease protein n=1 Tax=Flavihumibacter petaseus NBRC 106054 TaxID=1220578 RepID=A0A0E9MV82_9BACT|nr:ABC transporter permease [Flavihumibacter petaseus]GAO41479.1 hypothetical protein FPE01S_01_04920 [Flavihumibacter petaseus NBRC 106054]
MLYNFIKIALRNIQRKRTFAIINICGLALGMAISLLIGLWLTDEIGYDHYFTNHKRIVKGMVTQSSNGESYTGDVVSMAMGTSFRNDFKDLFTRTALTCDGSDHLVISGDKKFYAAAIWAQSELPEMLPFRMTMGSAAVLNDPSTAIISSSLAAAIFGEEDPVGKTVRMDNEFDLKIGGIYEDLPANNTFAGVKIVMPWYNLKNSYHSGNTDWNDHNGRLYAELATSVTAEQATARIKNLPTPHITGWKEEASVYPLDKFYLYSEFENGKASGGRIYYVWLFAAIGIFVLFLACINFMNMSTARSEKRAREVGIRKTIGSMRLQLVIQFLAESVLIAAAAFLLCLAIVMLSLPYFNYLADKTMVIPWTNPVFWILSIGFVLLTGLLAGSYPAFYLSGFDPVKVLKGTFRTGKNASLPRQVMVVLQFTVSMVLIVGTIVVFRQIQHGMNRTPGFHREGLVNVSINTPELGRNYEVLRQELLQQGLVENVASASMRLTAFQNNNELYWRGKRPDQESQFFRNVNVSADFGKTIGWKILQGRDFGREFTTDTNSLILNAAAVKVIGMGNPVGEIMKFSGKEYTVVGVADDMVTNSPFSPIEPAVFLGDGWRGFITIRLKHDRPLHTSLEAIGKVFRKFNPGSPFVYEFLDDAYARKFSAEKRVGNLAAVFTGLAIFISCLGLFGLTAFVAEQRRKEIGLRKILGAPVFRIWSLLSSDFLRLIMISFLVAIPLSWWSMNLWLTNYEYRTALPWWIFLLSALAVLMITLVTVSFQSVKAALMNPVKSIRTE